MQPLGETMAFQIILLLKTYRRGGGTTRGSRIFDSEKTVIHPSLDDAVPRRLSIIVAAIATAATLTLLPKRPKDVGLAGDYPILRGRNQEPRRG